MNKLTIHKFFALVTIFGILVLVTITGMADAEEFFKNPIGTSDVSTIIHFVANFIVTIGIPILVILLMLTGFKFVAAQGNDKKLSEARTMLFWTVIGIGIIMGAGLLAGFIVDFGASLGQ
jgi:hypothetical protein